MTTIDITKEDVLGRVKELNMAMETARDPFKEVLKKQIKHWEEVLDRFALNESDCFGSGRDYLSEDYYSWRDSEGDTRYHAGVVMVGDCLVGSNL